MFDIDHILIYHPNIILTSDVYDILDNMHKYLCNWTFNFRKVVLQQIWGYVVVAQFFLAHPVCNLRLFRYSCNYVLMSHVSNLIPVCCSFNRW